MLKRIIFALVGVVLSFAANAQTASRNFDFLNIIGVVGQVQSNITVYLNANGTSTDAQFIGARHFRDGLGATQSQQLAVFSALLAKGINLVAYPPDAGSCCTVISPAAMISALHQWQALGANALFAIEGPNEPVNFGITYNGVNCGEGNPFTACANFEKDYYAALKADPPLAPIIKITATQVGGEVPNVGLQFAKIPAGGAGTTFPGGTTYADGLNMHEYDVFSGSSQTVSQTGNLINVQLVGDFVTTYANNYAGYTLAQAQALPRYVTEYGLHVGSNGPGPGVDQVTQSKNLMTGLFNFFNQGYKYVAFYELYDEGDGFGLFNTTASPKQSATFLHNLTTIMNDTGANAATFNPGQLAFSITNLPSTGLTKLFQKSNGVYEIAAWNNINNYNLNTQADIPISPTSVGLTFQFPGTISVFDPTTGTSAISTVAGATTVTFTLRDYPMIISFLPANVGTAGVPVGFYAQTPGISGAGADPTEWNQLLAGMGITPVFFDQYYAQDDAPDNAGFGWSQQADFWANTAAADPHTAPPVKAIWAFPMGCTSCGNIFPNIAAGQYDTALNGIITGWKNHGYTDLYLRPSWEFNLPNNYQVTSGNLSQFIAAWKHIYTVLHTAATANGTTVHLVWNPAVGSSQVDASLSFISQYPGDGFVDVIALDAYGTNVDPGWPGVHDPLGNYPTPVGSDGQPTNLSYQAMLAMALARNKPIGLAETSSLDAAYPQAQIQAFNQRNPAIQIAFVILYTNNGVNFADGTHAATLAAWKAGYGPNGSVVNGTPAQPGTRVFWNQSDASGGIGLSNNFLTAATAGPAPQAVRVNLPQSSGKFCWEMTANTISNSWAFGLNNTAFVLTSPNGIGGSGNGIGYSPNSPFGNLGVFANGSLVSNSNVIETVGAKMTACADFSAQLFWVTSPAMRGQGNSWNNNTTADPAAGVGGLSFSFMACPCYISFGASQDNTGTGTLNATGPFAVAIPSGFGPIQANTASRPTMMIFGKNDNQPAANDNLFDMLYSPVSFRSR